MSTSNRTFLLVVMAFVASSGVVVILSFIPAIAKFFIADFGTFLSSWLILFSLFFGIPRLTFFMLNDK